MGEAHVGEAVCELLGPRGLFTCVSTTPLLTVNPEGRGGEERAWVSLSSSDFSLHQAHFA